MIYFDRINVSERIYVHKASESRECDICHYWYFLNKGFKFELTVCNGCHDSLMMPVDLSDIAFLIIKVCAFCCIISGISNSEAINLIQHADLTEKSETFENIKLYYHI